MTPAQKAITYLLDRAQTDPDLGYQIGPGTEAFRLLCEAEAADLGKDFKEVYDDRKKSYATRLPKVVELGERASIQHELLSRSQVAEAEEQFEEWREGELARLRGEK